MKKGFDDIFYGFLIISFRINIGGIRILPGFLGALLIFLGLSKISKISDINSFKKAKNISFVLFLAYILSDILEYINSIQIIDTMLTGTYMVMMNTLGMIAFYYIFEAIIEYYNENDLDQLASDTKLNQTLYLIMEFINIILINFIMFFNKLYLSFVVWPLSILILICLLGVLSQTRKVKLDEAKSI